MDDRDDTSGAITPSVHTVLSLVAPSTSRRKAGCVRFSDEIDSKQDINPLAWKQWAPLVRRWLRPRRKTVPLSPPLLIYFFSCSLFLSASQRLYVRVDARAERASRRRAAVDRPVVLPLSLRVLCLDSLTKKVFAPVLLRYGLHMSYAN